MGFFIVDAENESQSISTNAWNWGPTVEIIRGMNILDPDIAQMIRYNGGAPVTQDEARRIAKYIEENILSKIRPGERILHDGKITDVPDDGTFYRDELEKNYSVSYEWLVKFVTFCKNCKGFKVY